MANIQKVLNKANEKQKNRIYEEVNYWQEERATNNFLAGEKSALKIAKELKENFQKSFKEIEKEINSFYGKYAKESGMDLATAKAYLNKNELKDFQSYIRAMIKMGNKENFNAEELKEFKRLYNKGKITRLEELQANIRIELDKLTSKAEKGIFGLFKNIFEDTYYKSVYDVQMILGTDKAFSGLNKKAIDKAVSTKWNGANYSDNIWQNNKNTLTKMLNTEIPRGLTLGYNPKKLAKDVSNRMNIDYNNTVRVIRTEYAKVQNDATLKGYQAAGIKQYQILAALDERTCDICGDLYNGEIFDINEAETGVNYPPFHPNCRCTTISYFPKDEIDEMSDEELSKIGFITYDEWKKGLIKLEGDKVIYSSKAKKN